MPLPTRCWYREVQALRSTWAWVAVLGIAGLAWVAFIWQVGLGRPLGGEPLGVVWILFLVLGVGLPWFASVSELRIEVDERELRWTLCPLLTRRVRLTDIVVARPCCYRALRDFLGRGIRWWPGRGWAYTVDGNHGVQIILKSGQRILLGSQHAELLAGTIENARRTAHLHGQRSPTSGAQLR